jgi:hypothetical protein
MTLQSQLPSQSHLTPLRPSDLADAVQPILSWIWHGYLASGRVTACISPAKSGKTTLLALLLARFGQGGQLAGLAVAPSRCLVVSEESANDWDARCKRLAIGQHVQFLCRPFRGARPTDAQWFSLLAQVETLHRQEALDLVVIDPLATLLPGYAETCAPRMLDCLLPLQDLARLGPAVWLLHHPAKGKRADGEAARGSSALTGFADILMEMTYRRRARSRDRRRRICAYSRYVETTRHLIVELTADGADYLVRTDDAGKALVQTWPELHDQLAEAGKKLTLQGILEQWPEDLDPPDRSTLSRWLKRAADQGVILRSGSGLRGDPFHYWLQEREPFFWPGDDASEADKQAWKDRWSAYMRDLILPPKSA